MSQLPKLLHSRLRFARNDRTRDWNGNAYCARENLANTTRLIFMPEPYLCYPFNPWFFAIRLILATASRLWFF